MKKINKKTPLLLGVLSAVALGTVGFSAWIIGAINDTNDFGTKVTVETVRNESLDFVCTLGDEASINIGNGINDDTPGSNIHSDEGTVSNDMTLTVPFTIKVTGDYLNKESFKGFKDITYTWKTEPPKPASGDNKIGTGDRLDSIGGWNYIDLPDATDVTILNKSNIETGTEATGDWTVVPGTNTYTISSNIKLTFKWGDFFGYKANGPVEYYRTFEDKHKVAGDTYEFQHNIETELKKMLSDFQNQPQGIAITAKLNLVE